VADTVETLLFFLREGVQWRELPVSDGRASGSTLRRDRGDRVHLVDRTAGLHRGPALDNGAFTKALLEGLGGKADLNRERAVRVNGLASYLANRVKELTEGRQMPVMVAPKTVVEDFPIAAVPERTA